MKIAFCSDIHAHRYDQAADIEALVKHINQLTDLDGFLFAGDVSHHTDEVQTFLSSIILKCQKLWIPGNHDLWVIDKESDKDSSDYRYNQLFPEISNALGWHYLPDEPFSFKQNNCVVIGSIGWFSGEGFSEWFDDEADERNEQLAINFANDLEKQLQQVADGDRVVLAIHHVPHAECIPEKARFNGRINQYIQAVLPKYQDKIELLIHGHYHGRYEKTVIEGINYVAHPFGYPQQHDSVEDGVKVIEFLK